MIPARPDDRREPAIGAPGRRVSASVRGAWPALTVAIALAVSIVAASSTRGGSSGLLVVRAVVLVLLALAIATVLGVLAVLLLRLPTQDPRRGRLLDVAAGAAALWAVCAAVTAFLLYLGQAPAVSSPAFGPGLVSFVADIAIGRTWLIAAVAAAVLSTVLVAVRSPTGVAWLGALTVAAAVPVALQSALPGDSLAGGRTVAAAGLVQLLALSTWIGGTAVAATTRAHLPRVLPAGCFAAVAVAIGSSFPVLLAEGDVPPAAVVGGTAVALAGGVVVLGRVLRRPSPGLQLVLLAVGTGAGAAAAVSRALPDVPARTTPAEILTGAPLPPTPALPALVRLWQPDPLWLVVCGALLAGYGLAALRSRRWPVLRSVSWIVGVLLLAWLTSGAPAVYQEVLIDAHLLQHLGLLLVVPLLLAGGAPARLLASSSGRSGDVLGAADAPAIRVLARPVPAGAIAAGGLLALYGSDALRWSVSDPVGTEGTNAACVLVGALLVHALATPRSPRRTAVAVAIGLLVLESAGAVVLALASPLLLADWFGAMGWGTDALAAQQGGAGLAWALAAVPTALLLIRAGRGPAGSRAQLARTAAVST